MKSNGEIHDYVLSVIKMYQEEIPKFSNDTRWGGEFRMCGKTAILACESIINFMEEKS